MTDLQWREVGLPALHAAVSSGCTQFVPPELRPQWAQQLPSVTGAWLYYEGGIPLGSTGSMSTQQAQARLDIERTDPPVLKYYRYFFVELSDGRVFQLGPFKDLDYGHRLHSRPEWTRAYPSSSSALTPNHGL